MDPYALGSTPIPGDQPQGIDAKYDPEYTMVTEEIAKLGSATHGGSIVWATVATQGEMILETKSKDWQIAAYVAVAWQEIEGVAGIYKATQLFQALLENFWETSYPPLNKLRRRTNAFNWWHEYAYAALQKFSQDSELAEELVKKLAESLKNLDKLIGDLWPDATPLHDLQETVSRLRVLAKVEPPKAKEVVAKKYVDQNSERINNTLTNVFQAMKEVHEEAQFV
ncbi:MAG: type VI secretion system ImpA family N-terminal domain-containing protein, partial [Desulfovibrionaceae bacterium]|nr:type VI secretion system ImpA family N-terminal domain-containing protein [Desulfovibrionaceae bacterium]